jgi:hypothetical protein
MADSVKSLLLKVCAVLIVTVGGAISINFAQLDITVIITPKPATRQIVLRNVLSISLISRHFFA